jgi:hypothetical protein
MSPGVRFIDQSGGAMNSIGRGIVCALAAALPLGAIAGEPAAQGAIGANSFSALDRDGSGALSRDELKSHPQIVQHFDGADANTDGKLTAAEFTVLLATTTETETGAE